MLPMRFPAPSFPRVSGGDPESGQVIRIAADFPRVSGGDPIDDPHIALSLGFSPRKRG